MKPAACSKIAPGLPSVRLSALTVAAFLVVPVAAQAPVPGHFRAQETALDRYVATPDPAFAFSAAGTIPGREGVVVSLVELTSQRWLEPDEVDRPEWRHWLVVYRPSQVTGDTGLLFVGGGSNDGKRPAKANSSLLAMASGTRSIVAELRMVPNQPLTLLDDPERKPRKEDDLIAYTWDRYLRTGDERWPLRLPMTKAVVRAMDAVTAWTASEAGGGTAVRRFVVAGASKRGWTTWTTAAVDSRVVAIAPIVIDVVNVEPSMTHHWQAYGAWAPAVQDYVDHGIMNWMGTPPFRALMAIEDPWSYRDRLTMPKLILNSAGDQFFLPDSSRFYFDALPGENQLRYVPNSDHSLDETDAIETLHAFYEAVIRGVPRPRFRWRVDAEGALVVTATDRPRQVRLWQATNAHARDFRLETIGKAWTSAPLEPSRPNTWKAHVPAPPRGWTAFFVELTFDSEGRYPFVFTTEVRVAPDETPFPPPRTAGTAGDR